MPTQTEITEYMLSEYMASEGFTMRRPTVEEGHTKACMASSALGAVQNYRDAEEVSDLDFHRFLHDDIFHIVMDYLNGSEVSDCQCPQRVEEDAMTLRLRMRLTDTGEWRTETHFMTLTDAVSMISFEIDCGIYSAAYVGLDWGQEVTPALWCTLNMSGTDLNER